jgi:hypothetical protein
MLRSMAERGTSSAKASTVTEQPSSDGDVPASSASASLARSGVTFEDHKHNPTFRSEFESDEDSESSESTEEVLDGNERGHEQPISKQGWMNKKGGYKRRNWTRRWFVLRGSSLTYYSKERRNSSIPAPIEDKPQGKEPKNSKPHKKGVISLHSLRVQMHKHHTRPFVFTLTHPTNKARIYFLSCDSEEEQVQWMDLLQVSSWHSLVLIHYLR